MISIIERHAEMHILDNHFAQQIVIHKCHLFHTLIDHNSHKEHYLTRGKTKLKVKRIVKLAKESFYSYVIFDSGIAHIFGHDNGLR